MRVTTRTARKSIRGTLPAAAATCALLSAAALFSATAASASAGHPSHSGTALRAALRHDIGHYLTSRRKAEHISAVSLRVTFPGSEPAINLAVGTPGTAAGRLSLPVRCGRSAATPRRSPR